MKSKKIITVVSAAVLSVCLLALCFLGVMEMTLFKEGYLIGKIEKTGYSAGMSHAVRAACEGYAAAADLAADAATHYVTEEKTAQDIEQRIDGLFRGYTPVETSVFTQMSPDLRDRYVKENGHEPDELRAASFEVLQVICESAYQDAVKPPFGAVLSIILQYRDAAKWILLAFAVLGAGALMLLKTSLAADKAGFWQYAGCSALGAGAALCVAAVLGKWAVPFKTWMPESNIAYPLFCEWFGGVPTMLAVAGIVLAAVSFLLFAAKKTMKTQHAQPESKETSGAQAQASQAAVNEV